MKSKKKRNQKPGHRGGRDSNPSTRLNRFRRNGIASAFSSIVSFVRAVFGQGVFPQRYLLGVAVISQCVTVLITWPTWQSRDFPPNLPLFPLPDFDFGIIVMGSALLVAIVPKSGIWIHLFVLVVASMFDQMRLHPAFLANWILMFATTLPLGSRIARYFLISLWSWAGLHKLLSPDWLSYRSWDLVSSLPIDPTNTYLIFAAVVILSEVGLGVLAFVKPPWAAWGCLFLHFGIVLYLSPLIRDWNYSVIPWNIATGLVGFWILQQPLGELKPRYWEKAIYVALAIAPMGFYLGWIDHGFAHVLYSDNLPQGVITTLDNQPQAISTWNELAIPFPNERRLFPPYFGKTAKVGEKMHVHEPRRFLSDMYFVMTRDGPVEISAREFFSQNESGPKGIAIDPSRVVFELQLKGAVLRKANLESMFHSITLSPECYSLDVLVLVAQLPNIQQIQLRGTSVSDQDLAALVEMPCLVGVGLEETHVTDIGMRILSRSRTLQFVLFKGSNISDLEYEAFEKTRHPNVGE